MAAPGCETHVPTTQTSYEVVPRSANLLVERTSTAVPFPRGMALVDGKLYVLSRGRAREAGGVSGKLDDRAGTIFEVDPTVAEVLDRPLSEAVRNNARPVAVPTDPPFRLFDRSASPPTTDRRTDRPYCSLRYHDATRSFYVCAFSGIDKKEVVGQRSFSKNLSDALLRFDLRTQRWYEVERHDMEAGGAYPHHDPALRPPPHGWLNGPDNCLPVGNWLYAVAKDNSRLVRYDLHALVDDPNAAPPPGEFVLDESIRIRGLGMQRYFGHSMLAVHDDHLYVGYRTSSVIVRIKLDRNGTPVRPIVGELIARFEPYDPQTGRSANITDMDFDSQGQLYVISAMPSRVYRFKPDPRRIFDARHPEVQPWADMARITNNPKMKSENVLVDNRDRLYVTSGDAYGEDYGLGGAIYRVTAVGDDARKTQ